MFFNGSRYLRVADYTVPDADGTSAKLKVTRELAPVSLAFTYQVRQGDRLDLLAFKFYRNPRKWWLIADANPDCMALEQLLTPGRVIIVPKDTGI